MREKRLGTIGTAVWLLACCAEGVGAGDVTGIGGRVWEDRNRNGIQDAGEPSLPGVLVGLFDESGVGQRKIYTDGSGSYFFWDLTYGPRFRIGVSYYNYFRVTLPNQGDDDLLDNDVDPVTYRSELFEPVDASDAYRWDIGLQRGDARVGGMVWLDEDGDGIRDAEEPPQPDITVVLSNPNGWVVNTRTGGNGRYEFDTQFPGDQLTVRFFAPSGTRLTLQNQGSDDDVDSDPDPTTGRFTFILADSVFNIDAGLTSATATAGDRVWIDSDRDGVQDRREYGMEGVPVFLMTSFGTVIEQTTSGDGGYFLFTGLLPTNAYRLMFFAPQGFRLTVRDATDDEHDSDPNPATGQTAAFTPDGVLEASRWDAGLYPTCPSPDRPLSVSAVARDVDGGVTFTLSDPNDPSAVTGTRVRRHFDPAASILDWTIVGPDVQGTAWSDGPSGNRLLFYLFAAVNDVCGTEGPW